MKIRKDAVRRNFLLINFDAKDRLMRSLLDSNSFEIVQKNNEGRTLLHFAAMRPGDNSNLLNFLVSRGIDVNEKDKYGRSAIYYSSSSNTVKVLASLGADINICNDAGQTPLMYVLSEPYKKNMEDIAIAMIDIGANCNAVDMEGNKPHLLIKGFHCPKLEARIKEQLHHIDFNLVQICLTGERSYAW